MKGWVKAKQAAKYAGVSERTVRKWLKAGLKFSQLPSGTVLIRYEWVDDFLASYESEENVLHDLVNEVCNDLAI